jgi:hypothetical protein
VTSSSGQKSETLKIKPNYMALFPEGHNVNRQILTHDVHFQKDVYVVVLSSLLLFIIRTKELYRRGFM